MRKLIASSIAAFFMMTACASQPEKPWDKEGVRQRSDETGKKLEKEEIRH